MEDWQGQDLRILERPAEELRGTCWSGPLWPVAAAGGQASRHCLLDSSAEPRPSPAQHSASWAFCRGGYRFFWARPGEGCGRFCRPSPPSLPRAALTGGLGDEGGNSSHQIRWVLRTGSRVGSASCPKGPMRTFVALALCLLYLTGEVNPGSQAGLTQPLLQAPWPGAGRCCFCCSCLHSCS